MAVPEDKSKIEHLKEGLYSRNAPDIRTRRKMHVSDAPSSMQSDWEKPPEEPVRPVVLNQEYERHHMSFFTKLLIASAIFCVIAVGIGAYIFLNGVNLVSANNIDITIDGPVSIPGGTPSSFDVVVTNKNNVDLQLVDMSVTFPAGTVDPNNPSQPLDDYEKLIGDLAAGQSAKQTVTATIFGEQNLQKEIDVTITYSVKGSSAVFTKTQTYDVLINSSPINMTVTSYSQITSGQPFDMTIDVKSNSQDALDNVILTADYPFGFTFISSSLPPLSGNTAWNIGDLPPGADRTLTIHGSIQGEDSDVRAFHFSVGAQDPTDTNAIGTEYMTVEQDMTIQKPFVSLAMSIDNDQTDGIHVGQFGQFEHVQISWFNNLPTTVTNMQITADLSGTAYDPTTIQPDSGYFDSGTNEITWSQQTNPELASVAAGANGTVSFGLTPKDLSTVNNEIVNPAITITLGVSGDRTDESNVPGSLASAVSRTINVASDLTLTGRLERSTGPFANTGPIPPQANQPTTYTVDWIVDNTANSAGDAQVTAVLPPYVKWLGNTSPDSEDVSYDPNSGTVTWNIGNVNTYTVASSRRREADFQISFTPAVNQVGSAPTLVNEATLTATDNFTSTQLTSTQDFLTTSFSTDPAYQEGDELVVQ